MEAAFDLKVPVQFETNHRSDDSINPAAVVVWVMIQLITLLVAGMDLPLFARPTEAASRYALIWMASTQFAILSLLFPWLLANLRQSLFIFAATPPFVALAGFMAQAAVESIATVTILILIWLCGLSVWRSILSSPTLGQIGICLASSLCIGGAAVTYLLVEFGDMNRNPILGQRTLFVALLIHLAMALIAWCVARLFRAKLSTGLC